MSAESRLDSPPGCWQQANFSESLRYALDKGLLDPNTFWTEDDLVFPKSNDHGGCQIASPGPDEKFEGAWFRWNTPLHRAIWVDDLEGAEKLLVFGADINKRNRIGLTPLHEAVRSGKTDAVVFLFEHGADGNGLTVEDTAQWWVRAWSTGDVSREEVGGDAGQVALHFSMFNGETAMTSLLIDRGVELNPACVGKWTFLDLALLSEDREAVTLFWARGVRPSTGSTDASIDYERDARQLLAVATSDRIQPPDNLHPVYQQVLSQVKPEVWSRFEHDPLPSAFDQLIQSFFDILYVTARVRPAIPTVTFCERCIEFYGQLRYHKYRDHPRFPLHRTRQDLQRSASQGCYLCSLVADALDEDEPRVKREAESGETYYMPPDAEPDPEDEDSESDPGVYVKIVKVPGAFDNKYNLDIRCQKWWNSLAISRVEENAFPLFNPQDEDRMGLGAASERTFQTARSWLQNCKTSRSHSACQKSSQSTPSDGNSLPSRLIYVPPSGGAEPHLVKSDKVQQGEPYVAISYCWGLTPTIKTTTSNLAQHLRSIGPITSLPATIRDAILTTRGLGLSYIWIDALCIVQDDAVDWSSEAKRMHLIYLNAEVTISSLTSSSSTDPLFLPYSAGKMRSAYPVPIPFWEPKCLRPLYSSFCSGTKPVFYTQAVFRSWLQDSVLLTGPIHTRGWTLQEQLLSSRTLLFSSGLVHWECLSQYTTEADPTSSLLRTAQLGREVPQMEAKSTIMGLQSVVSQDEKKKTWDRKWYWRKSGIEVWEGLVSELSKRDFTRFSDRVPAFLGVSQFMGGNKVLDIKGGGEEQKFVGGIWTGERLLESLCWDVVTFPLEERGGEGGGGGMDDGQPSWTWVGVKGEIRFRYMDRSGREGMEPVSKVFVEGVTADVDAVTFRVTGEIILRGRLYEKTVLDVLFESEWRSGAKYSFDYERGVGKEEGLYILEVLEFLRGPLPTGFGYPVYPDGRPPERVFLILQAEQKDQTGSDGDETQVDKYRRVGVGSFAWEYFRGLKNVDDPLLEAGCVVEEDKVVCIV